MTALNSEGIKPCPFCGGEAKIEHSVHEDNHWAPRDFHHVRVICGECEVSQDWLEFGEMMDRHREQPEAQVEAERKAIAAWNRRALPPVDGLEVVALDLTKRIEREFYSDQPGGAVQTRAKVQLIVTEALSQASSVIEGLTAERDDARTYASASSTAKLESANNSLLARISSLEEENKRLSEALEAAKVWHEAEDKALSKQPPSSGPNGNAWARLQHQKQMREIETALLPTTEDHNG